jgi:hypothetical protein
MKAASAMKSGMIGMVLMASVTIWIAPVDPAAEIARDAADDEGHDEGDEHAEGADRERGVDRVEGAREDVLAGVVGAEEVDEALVHAEEMGVRAEGPDVVGPALDEELNVAAVLRIDGGHPAEVGGEGPLALHPWMKGRREQPLSSQNIGICGAPLV